MSDKMECPGCESYTSSVLANFENGEPCPYCELPHEAAAAIIDARRRAADGELTKRYEKAIKRAARAEAEMHELRRTLRDIREALDQLDRRQAP